MATIDDLTQIAEEQIQPLLAEALKAMLSSVTGDLKAYTLRMAKTAALLAQATVSGDDAAITRWKDNLEAQILSLASITSDREADRWTTVLGAVLNLVVKLLIAAIRKA